MSIDDFWYHYEYLFELYQKAYLHNIDTKAWLQGVYITKALEASILTYMPLAVAQGSGLTKAKYKPLTYPTAPLNAPKQSSQPIQELSDDAKREKELELLKHWV